MQELAAIFMELLRNNRKAAAASMLWPPKVFSFGARSVRLIWEALEQHDELLVMGAAAQGKTLSAAGWLLLDYLEDPDYTCLKVMSSTALHAERNLFGHIKSFVRMAALDLGLHVTNNSIASNNDERQGIQLTAIPMGDDGSGRLRGFHPFPRNYPHPKYGDLSRIRVIMDEAEAIPGGVWEEVNNLLSTQYAPGTIKVYAASNPKDPNSRFGRTCEPDKGWSSLDYENEDQWKSKQGWNVLRLDAKKSENVVARRMVYPGFMTFAGYERYEKMGVDSLEYHCMARGMFPPDGIQASIVPNSIYEKAIGSYIFHGEPQYCMSADIAFVGDRAVCTVGRYGRVAGYDNNDGTSHRYAPDEHVYGIEIVQQFELSRACTLPTTDPKFERPTVFISGQICDIAKNLNIPPQWIIIDKTSYGQGVEDVVSQRLGEPIVGVMFAAKATDKKIMRDDSVPANQQCSGLVTELFLGMKKWMEFDAVKINAHLAFGDLKAEVTARRYRQIGGGLIRVESKQEYKSRARVSPDLADSLTLIVFLARMRGDGHMPYMEKPKQRSEEDLIESGHVDKMQYLSFE